MGKTKIQVTVPRKEKKNYKVTKLIIKLIN